MTKLRLGKSRTPTAPREKVPDTALRLALLVLPPGSVLPGPSDMWVCASYLGFKTTWEEFPGGAVVKNPPANAGNTGSSAGPGRSHTPWSN